LDEAVVIGLAGLAGGPSPQGRDAEESGQRNLVLFEAMQTMIECWGAEVTAQFFAHCCPQLLDLGAIAYWSVPSGQLYPGLRRTIEEITQCVLVVGDSGVFPILLTPV
jgi:hypothetical protein